MPRSAACMTAVMVNNLVTDCTSKSVRSATTGDPLFKVRESEALRQNQFPVFYQGKRCSWHVKRSHVGGEELIHKGFEVYSSK